MAKNSFVAEVTFKYLLRGTTERIAPAQVRFMKSPPQNKFVPIH